MPGDGEGLPAVLFVPDLLLSQQAGFYPRLCERLAQKALVLGIDAGSSGYLPTRPDPDPERAAHYRLGSEIADLVRVVEALKERELPQSQVWDGQRLCIVGHGKGAALALHLERRLLVQGLAFDGGLGLLCPPSSLLREGWPETGDARITVPLDGGFCVKLAPGFLDDARALASMAALPELVACSSWPLLFVAGEEDCVFSIAETEELLAHAGTGKARFCVIEKVGHAFSADETSRASSPALERVAVELERFVVSLGRPAIEEQG